MRRACSSQRSVVQQTRVFSRLKQIKAVGRAPTGCVETLSAVAWKAWMRTWSKIDGALSVATGRAADGPAKPMVNAGKLREARSRDAHDRLPYLHPMHPSALAEPADQVSGPIIFAAGTTSVSPVVDPASHRLASRRG